MGMLYRTIRVVAASGVLAIATFATSCTNPVKDHEIARLGPEADGVSPGPEHRPGQPCVLCHSDGGTAKGKFAIAGTVYTTSKADKGVDKVKIFILDGANADRQTTSNAVGNFFIRDEEWPDLTYPFKTGVEVGTTGIKMQSTVNREGSCNFCHKPPGGDPRESIGPITAPGGG